MSLGLIPEPRHIGLCRAEGHRQRVNSGDWEAPSWLLMIATHPAASGGDKPVLELLSQILSTSKAISFIVGAECMHG